MNEPSCLARASLRRWMSLLGWTAVFLGLACSSEDSAPPPGASGGSAPATTGGTTGGSKPNTGGTMVTGGTLATGGTMATGGTLATGGTMATGGTIATGGVAGSAGGGSIAGGTSGSGGSGGTPAVGGGGGGGSTGGAQGVGGAPSGGTSGGGAGGGAGKGGSGGGGAAGFEPCPAQGEDCKILPLGDSITDGFNIPGGYRMELFDKAVADGKNLTYVGNSMNGPDTTPDGQPFPKRHEGHSGWTIGKLDTDVVPEPALNQDPHIVLLHIGTNDMNNANGAPARLDTLIQQLVTAAPDALIAVSTIIPYPAVSAAVDTFNAAVPGIVKKHADAGKHVIFVEQFEDFPNSELADGIHPNQAGYARMAGRWYEAIKAYLR